MTTATRRQMPSHPAVNPIRHRARWTAKRMAARFAGTAYLTAADSIEAYDLPAGFDAYIGYTDGYWPSIDAIVARFPGVPTLGLTTGLGDADGIDCEEGNVSWDNGQADLPGWVVNARARGVARPNIYMGVYTVGSTILACAARGVTRAQLRFTTAHWTGYPHICTSADCDPSSPVSWTADATQWADKGKYDVNLLTPTFFADAPTPTPTPTPTPAPAPPAPIPAPTLKEDDMKVVIVSTPSKTNKRPVFSIEGGYKRWLPNESFVKVYLDFTGQTEPIDLGSGGWDYLVGPRPDAPGSSPVPGQ
jgi:hypothetical protein